MRHFKHVLSVFSKNGTWVLVLLLSLGTTYLCFMYSIYSYALIAITTGLIALVQLLRKRYIVYPQKRDALTALMLVNKNRSKSVEFRKDTHEEFWVLRLTAFEIIGKDELVECYLGIIDDKSMTWKSQQQAVLGYEDSPNTIIFDQYPLSFTAAINLFYKLAAIQNNAINAHSIFNAKTLIDLVQQANEFDSEIRQYKIYEVTRKALEFLGIITYKRRAADEKKGNLNGATVKIEK